ncbi:MAG TPA: hypothetical protein VK636_02290, partial [Gemmatimonadaceae bacterium]|nr:hypothetical protein [Gemmatimonadaceae bacterium]
MTGTDIPRGRFIGSRVLVLVLAFGVGLPALARAQNEYGGAATAPTARAGTVSGRVHAAGGQPLAGVLVQLDQLERAGQTRAATAPRSDT